MLLLLALLVPLFAIVPAAAAPRPKVINRPPEITKPANRTDAEGDSIALQIAYRDPDGDPLSITASGLPKGLGIGSTGLISGKISYDAARSHTVKLTVKELRPGGKSASTSFSWKVTNTNRPPILATIGEQSLAAGTSKTVAISASDPDGTAVRLTASGTPSFATFSASGGKGKLTLKPGLDQVGVYPMTIAASDGTVSVSESFSIVVTRGENRAPQVAAIGPVEVAEGGSASVTVTASDPDGDPLAAVLAATPAVDGFATLTPAGAGAWTLTVAPDHDDAGDYQATITVTDSMLSTTVGFPITVTDTNRAPEVAAPGDQQVGFGEQLDLFIDAHDPDGDVLSFAATGLPPGTSIDPATGHVSGAATTAGSFPVEVSVSDGKDTVTVTFSVVVDDEVVVPPSSPRIDLRVLLIASSGGEPSIEAWKAVLRSRGVGFDVVLASGALTSEDLATGPDHALYQGVVVASSAVWEELSADERAAVEAFQRDFGIRKVTSYIYPSSTYGLTPPSTGGVGVAEGNLTLSGAGVFRYLAGPVPFESWAWGYEGARPLATADFTTLVAGPGGSSLIGINRTDDGREDLVSTVDSNPWTIHTRLLVPGMLDWVTRGVSTGFGRDHLSIHVDDILLGDDRWDPVANTTVEDGPNPIRMVAADVGRAMSWQSSRGVVLDWVYNGLGASEYGQDDPLTAEVLEQREAFRWINHTYTHLNLDAVSEDAIVDEIERNVDWALANDVTFSAAELVTGEHSGLSNPAMAGALQRAGISWIASDNSRTPQQSAIGPALTVPRHPANIYYNVGTRAEQLDEYNFIYYDGCTPSPTHTCLSSPASWEQYVDAEATIMLSHIVGNDPRPHYVHQSNLAEDGVLYDIVDEVLDRYERLFTTDLLQPTLQQAGELLRDHDAWNAALAAGRVTVYLQDGVVHIEVTSPTRVPLTGTSVGTVVAGTRSGWVQVTGSAQLPVDTDPGYGPLASASGLMAASPVASTPDPREVERPLPLAPAPTSDELGDLTAHP